ncbi:PREDICTED: zinc finger BED domain-containing protein DAYSLEEPER-like [Ipomoea nil]|uniref:zinc finger BED domain-containing protein DAYSLEEPER-like n=1 Tax=Ipomoea nil TaxID=35883 RepID=UPI0009015A8B|nr:PREDICTED: zinc finger BED domain-containing protein DAYSLEEPER-like [Ipomoea nil]
MDTPTDNNELANSERQPNKRRRKKSIVWEHFTLGPINGDSTKAYCNHCRKSFAYVSGTKLAGTSHLKRHIDLGICPVSRLNQDTNQLAPYNPASQTQATANGADRRRKYSRATSTSTSTPFDQNTCNYMIAKMVIEHDYPLHIVEDTGFINFAQTLQPQFNSSVAAIEEIVMSIYSRGKQSILNLLNGIPGRISLTLDIRTSAQSISYVVLTGYFIDFQWKFHRRLLNVIKVPFPESDFAFGHAVATCLVDWCLENKLFTVTLDQSFAKEAVKDNLRSLLSIKNLILNGQLVIGNCYARVLSQLAKDALESMTHIVEKVRQSVKYVKTEDAHEKKFLELKQQLQVPSVKELTIDDYTKWDTTYQMLTAASELKEVFSCLDTCDPDYTVTLSMDEWKQVEILCSFLNLFFNAANVLAGPTYPTANVFYNKVCTIQLKLKHAASSHDHFVSSFTRPLQETFDEYWKDCSLVLAVAAVMDPRFKMKLVEHSFSKIYDREAETWIRIVDDGLHELFLDYFVQSLPPPIFLEDGIEPDIKSEASQEDNFLNGDCFSDFDVYVNDFSSNQHQMKSELDQYLDELLMPCAKDSKDFDVLGWWEMNRFKYPILSKMASDILSIPVSTVPPDSLFDTVKRNVDSFQSSLRPTTLEALICAKDWMQYETLEPQPVGTPTEIVKIEY